MATVTVPSSADIDTQSALQRYSRSLYKHTQQLWLEARRAALHGYSQSLHKHTQNLWLDARRQVELAAQADTLAHRSKRRVARVDTSAAPAVRRATRAAQFLVRLVFSGLPAAWLGGSAILLDSWHSRGAGKGF